MDFLPEERVTIPLDAHKRCGVCRHIWHELCQVLDESNKSLYLVQVVRLPPLAYPRHLICVCGHHTHRSCAQGNRAFLHTSRIFHARDRIPPLLRHRARVANASRAL